jgi:hypothetical protein
MGAKRKGVRKGGGGGGTPNHSRQRQNGTTPTARPQAKPPYKPMVVDVNTQQAAATSRPTGSLPPGSGAPPPPPAPPSPVPPTPDAQSPFRTGPAPMETERGSPADATPGANVPIPMVTPNSVQNTMVPTHNPLSAAASSGSASDGLPSMPPPLPRLDWAHAADGRGMGRPLPPPPLIPFSLPSSVLSTTFSTRSRCCPRYSSSSAANSSTLIRAWSLASGFSRRARSTSA